MGERNIYERFLWFEALVKAGKYPNASRLARQFEISIRTAQRDIEFMRDRLKCPLKYDVAAKGYYYEDGTFSLPLIQLSTDELSALLMARKLLLDISDGALGREITAVLDKMASILRKRIALPHDMDDAVSFQMIQRTPTPERTVRTVLEACIRDRKITFGYWSPLSNNTTTRTVDPYHLLNYMGTWQLIAFCHLREDFRHFNLMRMSNLEVLDDSFVRKPGFDVHEFITSSFGIFKGNETVDVTLRFSPKKTRWMQGTIWYKGQKERILPDGSLELTFPVADFSEIAMEVLKHGSMVEVIEPKELRDIIRDEAKAIAALYR